jgi:AraC-like DNA-binding protein
MRVTLYVPQPAHELISDFWEMKFADTEIPLTQTIPPFGKPELIFYLGEPFQIREAQVERCLIKGQYTLLQAVNLKKNSHLFGIRLQPYALYSLFDFDPYRLNDQVVDGRYFELTQAISNLLQNTEVITVPVLQQVTTLLNQHHKKHVSASTLKFLQQAVKSETTMVGDILERTGFSIRTVQRNFLKEVGMTPKKYLRLIRVNQIEEMLRGTNDWIEVVTRFNLADQSHLIREIKSFRQNNPTELVNRKLLIHEQLPAPEIIPIDLTL